MRRDLACAALGLALAAACYIAADALPRSMLADEVGADGVPKLLAALLAALSLAIGARGLGGGPAGSSRTALRPHLRSLGVAALGAAYVALVPWLGFAPSIALLLLAAMLYYGAPPRWATVVRALLGAAALWALFAQLLSRAA